LLQLTWEVGIPSSPVEFSSLHHSHKLSCSCLLGECPRSHQSLSSPSGLFIYSPRKDSLPPIFSAQGTPPSFPSVFIVLIAYYSVSVFSLSGVRSVQGLCCSGPGLSVRVPWYREAHLVCVFPSHLGMGDWWPGGPPCFPD
jgi:hypothetical protein